MNEPDVKEWIRMASHDIETADLLVKEQGHADIIIYHLHQAAEKLLKALTIKSGKIIDKIHFLDKLLTEIIEDYPELEKIKDYILELNLYLPKLRYPSGDEIKFDEAEALHQKFKHIKKVLFGLLNI